MTLRTRYKGRQPSSHTTHPNYHVFEIDCNSGILDIHEVSEWASANIEGNIWRSLVVTTDMYITYSSQIWIERDDQATIFKLAWGGTFDEESDNISN